MTAPDPTQEPGRPAAGGLSRRGLWTLAIYLMIVTALGLAALLLKLIVSR